MLHPNSHDTTCLAHSVLHGSLPPCRPGPDRSLPLSGPFFMASEIRNGGRHRPGSGGLRRRRRGAGSGPRAPWLLPRRGRPGSCRRCFQPGPSPAAAAGAGALQASACGIAGRMAGSCPLARSRTNGPARDSRPRRFPIRNRHAGTSSPALLPASLAGPAACSTGVPPGRCPGRSQPRPGPRRRPPLPSLLDHREWP